jgi:hypothetical protein
MGLFDGIGDAQVGQGGVYFLPGSYLVEVVRCFTLKSRKREDLFIAECYIHESDNPDRKPGSKASWVVNFKQDAALGNIKGFIAACLGVSPSNTKAVDETVDIEACELAVDGENPLAGTMLRLWAVNKITKSGNDFTLHNWEPHEAAA